MGWVILVALLTPYLVLLTLALALVGVDKVMSPTRTDDLLNGTLLLFLSVWCFIAIPTLWDWVL